MDFGKTRVTQIPLLEDNYAYLITDLETGKTLLVDSPEAGPVEAVLSREGWKLVGILNTHHHWDHIGANEALIAKNAGLVVFGFESDAQRIPGINRLVHDQERVEFEGFQFEAIHTPGHTLGHVCYYFSNERLLFCGDTLFAGGCGRLFEGTATQLYHSLKDRLLTLPPETTAFCAHEYTEKNLRFALTQEPNNLDLQKRFDEVLKGRARGEPTVPFSLAEEAATNPFVRSSSVEEFAQRRKDRDHF